MQCWKKQLGKCSGLTCKCYPSLDPLLYKAKVATEISLKLGKEGILILGLHHKWYILQTSGWFWRGTWMRSVWKHVISSWWHHALQDKVGGLLRCFAVCSKWKTVLKHSYKQRICLAAAQQRQHPFLFQFQVHLVFKIKTFQTGNSNGSGAQTHVLPAVMRREQPQSRIRSQRESAEKPANWQRSHNQVSQDTKTKTPTPKNLEATVQFTHSKQYHQALTERAKGGHSTVNTTEG